MTRRAGSADLPLHGGHVPKWLADRMTRLGAVMTQAIVHHYGRDEFLRRLSHPFWFQSFGAVMGMDWHSSGITTSVIGALKRGLAPLGGELGIHVCGGRGKHSRQTPAELFFIGERVGFDGLALANASRLVAKVDSAAVQDGFDLYLHGFIVTDDGKWVVVQQGMNGGTGLEATDAGPTVGDVKGGRKVNSRARRSVSSSRSWPRTNLPMSASTARRSAAVPLAVPKLILKRGFPRSLRNSRGHERDPGHGDDAHARAAHEGDRCSSKTTTASPEGRELH
jgi:hypothetical protein